MAVEGSHVNEDLPSHGTWVMPVPDPITIPEKEEGRVADMPSAGGPRMETLNPDKLEGARRRSQKFTNLCEMFEEARQGMLAKQRMPVILSLKFKLCSKDIHTLSKVSNCSSKEPPHYSFSSLRDNWENKA